MENTIIKTIQLEDKKESINRCKKAFLLTNGDFNVEISKLQISSSKLFKYKLEIDLIGTSTDINKFLERIYANYNILQGNMLGILHYLK